MKDRVDMDIGAKELLEDWTIIDWRSASKRVRNLRRRIYRATKNAQWNEVRSLMKLMLRSHANLLVSVRKVTQENKGKRTAGIDNQLILSPKTRVKLVQQMSECATWSVKPAKRIYIPKVNGKQRPLGILTIKNRVAQAIVKNALEPSWEARFESHSYGFRPGRSTHDAIEQCWRRLNRHCKDRWVLDADVKSAFDNISHDFILQRLGNIPARGLIKQWLKAGYVEAELFHDTTSGVQQGGVISPVLANVALDGIQELIGSKVGFIRYADDFVVTARTKEQIEALKPVIAKWLSERGLVMNEEKTRIVPVETGFDFLGFNIRHYRNVCLVKPAKTKVLALLNKIRQWLKDHRQVEAGVVIRYLNTLLRGWTQYYKCASSGQTFSYVKHQIWSALWKWCKRRHPGKSQTWIKRKYFRSQAGRDWGFFAETTNEKGERVVDYLIDVSIIPIERHIKVRGAASPDDPDQSTYWNERKLRGEKRLAEPGSTANSVRRMLRA